MNQAIQFPDRESWDAQRHCICFPALVNGMQLNCAITGETIAARFGGETPAEWLALFQEYRWDLEDEAEAAIKAQREDDHGWIWLS